MTYVLLSQLTETHLAEISGTPPSATRQADGCEGRRQPAKPISGEGGAAGEPEDTRKTAAAGAGAAASAGGRRPDDHVRLPHRRPARRHCRHRLQEVRPRLRRRQRRSGGRAPHVVMECSENSWRRL